MNNRACGCGAPFADCAFWTSVGEAAFGGWGQVDAARLNHSRRTLVRSRSLPALWRARSGAHVPLLEEYAATLSALYGAIARVSGASVVVDNSKQVAGALVAERAGGVDLRLVHLVRAAQGVAYSWTKHVARADMGGNEMRRRGAGRTALRWDADNLLLEQMGRRGTPRMLLRYEDFVQDARTSTERVLAFLGEPGDDLSYVGADWADLGVEHSVWGNPMRSRAGRETIRRDDDWRTALAPRDTRVVSALTAPVARRFRG
jgi:hypothetical protein